MADYIVNSASEQARMLERVGVGDVRALFTALPQSLYRPALEALEKGKSEAEVMAYFEGLAAENRVFKSIFRGAGAYKHFIPAAVDQLAARSEFVTAYTPYQAELAQGTLQTIFEFQTEICALTGMDAANASVYDGATAAGEAVLMCAERRRRRFLLAGSMNPAVLAVAETYCAAANYTCERVPLREGRMDLAALAARLDADVAALLMDQVNYFGLLEEVGEAAALTHAAGAKLVLGINPIAAAILPSAADCGADVAIGEAQPLGIPLSFGGPYLGFMATKQAEVRRLPGRIVGQTKDLEGRRAFVLTLQAREQHIRREKAISSICSNQGLMMVRATIYMAMQGTEGMRETARRCVDNAHYLAELLCAQRGFAMVYAGEFFHEFVLDCAAGSAAIEAALLAEGILPGLPLDGRRMLWCATECNSRAEMHRLVDVLKEAGLC